MESIKQKYEDFIKEAGVFYQQNDNLVNQSYLMGVIYAGFKSGIISVDEFNKYALIYDLDFSSESEDE